MGGDSIFPLFQYKDMRKIITFRTGFIVGLLLVAAACQRAVVTHKLVVTGNEHSIPLYQDEDTYLKVSKMRQEGGVEGMVGSIGKQFVAKDIDDQTPVKIVSSDTNGAVVEIIGGPMKGQTGFVAAQNIY